MKKSTYILMGMIGLGLLTILAFFVYLILYCSPYQAKELDWRGKAETITFPVGKVVTFLQPLTTNESSNHIYEVTNLADFVSTKMEVVASETEVTTFTFPVDMKPYLHTEVVNDTIRVTLQIPTGEQEENASNRYRRLKAQALKLAIPATVQQVKVDWRDLLVHFNGMKHDSLSVEVLDRVCMDNCRFYALKAQADRLILKKGLVEKLYVHFRMHRRTKINMEDATVNQLIYSGEGKHRVEWNSNACQELKWIPLNESASLEVLLTQPVTLKKVN